MPWYSSVHRGSGYKSRLATDGVRGRARRRSPSSSARAPATRRASCATRPRRSTSWPPRCPRARACSRTAVEHHANMLPWRRHDADRAARSRQRVGARASAASTRCGPRGRGSTCVAVTGRVERHRRGVAAGRARRASRTTTAPSSSSTPPSSRRIAPSTWPATGIDYLALSGHKLYAPFGAGALVALRPRPRARRAAAARRRRDRARHARRRRLGRRARALRGRLAQRRGRRRARRGLPDPRRSSAWTRVAAHERGLSARLAARRWRACRACGRSRSGTTRRSTASASRPSSSRATATRCWPRS